MTCGTCTKAIVLGTGSQAKVVIEILHAMDALELIGCVSSDPDALLGRPFLGDWDRLPEIAQSGAINAAVGVGGWTDNKLRREVLGSPRRPRSRSSGRCIHPS